MRNRPHRKEVQAFVVASEELYRLLSHGDSLSVGERETVMCCLDELHAQGRFAWKCALYSHDDRPQER
jgi:hypothetical protein